MGSTSTRVERGEKSLDIIKSEYDWTKYTLLADATKRVQYPGEWTYVHYMAIQDNASGEVLCAVTLFKRTKYELYWKSLSDTMGPCDINCPNKILDLLSPTEDQYALEWRARCREFNGKPEVKLTRGATVRLAAPIRFSDGVTEDTFTFLERSTFRRAGDGRGVRITSWRTRYQFEVLPA